MNDCELRGKTLSFACEVRRRPTGRAGAAGSPRWERALNHGCARNDPPTGSMAGGWAAPHAQGREVAVMDLGTCTRVVKADPELCLPAFAIELRLTEGGRPRLAYVVAPDLEEFDAWMAALRHAVCTIERAM